MFENIQWEWETCSEPFATQRAAVHSTRQQRFDLTHTPAPPLPTHIHTHVVCARCLGLDVDNHHLVNNTTLLSGMLGKAELLLLYLMLREPWHYSEGCLATEGLIL